MSKKPKTIDLSVAIVNYKTPELTRKLLMSLKREGLNLEIVLLDNGSNDGIGEIVSKEFPDITFIQSEINSGFSKGYNTVMDQCHGDYLLMLNSDIEVRKGALVTLLNGAKERKGKAVATCKLILPDGSTQKSAFHIPSVSGAIREYFFSEEGAYFAYLPEQSKPTRIEGAVMACFLIPRNIWQKAGKLDEGTSLYFEDVEYCKRLLRMDIPIYYFPQAVFDHHHGASSKKLPNQDSTLRLRKASIRYHGWFKYQLITLILWLGQKLRPSS